jgi:Ca2+-binding RTX toxin-like protein
VIGNTGSNSLVGQGGSDYLVGNGGSDTFIGASSTNTMVGGSGKDLYYVGDSGDVIIDLDTLNASGFDTVVASANFVLTDASQVEYLLNADNTARSLTGNSLANYIVGGTLGDTFNGLAGNDTILGGGGTDSILGGDGDDLFLFANSTALDTASTVVGGSGSNDSILLTQGSALDLEDNDLEGVTGVEFVSLYGGNVTLDGFANTAGIISLKFASASSVSLGGNFGNANFTLEGSSGNDTVAVGSATAGFRIFGGAGADSIVGGSGGNILDGGDGIDTLVGGAGNDTYYVTSGDSLSDSGGTADIVYASESFTLVSGLEALSLTGASDLNGWGSGLGDSLFGNSGANSLFGNDGADTLFAGAGADYVEGGTGDDSLLGDAGSDWILGGTGNDTVNGGAEADSLYGNGGQDYLDGGDSLTANYMAGGGDNDTYVVRSSSDTIVENLGSGTDVVLALASFTLPANVERINVGAANIRVAGSAGVNTLSDSTSYAGSTLAGGDGNDVYLVGNSLTNIVEDSGFGTDSVLTDVSWTLGANLETLVLTTVGVGASLTGNSGANSIAGNTGADSIIGLGGGLDTLTGGVGSDTFYLGATSGNYYTDASSNYVTITDFTLSSGTAEHDDWLVVKSMSGGYDLSSDGSYVWLTAYATPTDDGTKIARFDGGNMSSVNLSTANNNLSTWLRQL